MGVRVLEVCVQWGLIYLRSIYLGQIRFPVKPVSYIAISLSKKIVVNFQKTLQTRIKNGLRDL